MYPVDFYTTSMDKPAPTSNIITSGHYVYPASLYVSGKEEMVHTVLGSCVAVCLYDTRLQIGGMNHYLMPQWNNKGMPSPRYGNIAIDMLVKKMEREGSQKKDLVAKVFGGADQHGFKHKLSVGKRNIAMARATLKRLAIPIVSQDILGNLGRKIVFNVKTGAVYLKTLRTGLRTAAHR
jgi:chemotaxis protein CheD